MHINSGEGNYICTYDIPYELLDLYCGVGIYLDYINWRERTYAVEFAIPTKELKLDYLKRVDKLLQCIDYEDFLHGEMPKELYETIYEQPNSLIRKRKK